MKKTQMLLRICAIFVCVCCLFACSGPKEQHNLLTDQEKKDGWTLLFDGNSLSGWHLFNRGNIPSALSANRISFRDIKIKQL